MTLLPPPPSPPAGAPGDAPIPPRAALAARIGETAARRWSTGLCFGAAAVAVVLLLHNFGLPLLPERSLVLPPGQLEPLNAAGSPAYVFAFAASAPDRPHNPWSRARLFEDGVPLVIKTVPGPGMLPVRGGSWMHEPGYVIFSASDNSDPRTSRHVYTLRYPPFSSGRIGLLAGMVFVVATLALHGLTRGASARSPGAARAVHWRWHAMGIMLVFLAGLYANTGTLSPYAITSVPDAAPATGYLYNMDHASFRALFDLLNGENRSAWEHSTVLRRILYPVLAWPFMRLGGFEVGGVVAALVFNCLGLAATLWFWRRQIGERGAIFAGWLLALYPGAAYWAGQPFPYALIVPGSLLLMTGLVEISRPLSGRRLVLLSSLMGVAYLAYDLAVYFLPATLLVLAWQRRWRAALLAASLQMVPTLLWSACLHWGLQLPLVNSNSGVYGQVLQAWQHRGGAGAWWARLVLAQESGWHAWFGANFAFLPALALGVLVFNPLTSRVRPIPAELALLLTGAGLFLVINLSPSGAGPWDMHGSWISRLYQPVFPALVYFAARWWQALPPLPRWSDGALRLAMAGVLAGNALIVFGPILNNPGRISEDACYAFYTHSDKLLLHPYALNLEKYGRRPLGFPRPSVREP